MVETQDPYSVATGVNGQRSMVLDLKGTDPKGFAEDKGPQVKSRTDMVICEISVADITGDASSNVKNPGKFLGLTEEGTKNAGGQATGLDYLKQLGITHVQIMPAFDFASIDESHPEIVQYNWGYDPVNYNVPEGSYSTDAFRGEVRIREMKEMVAALHKAGIGVIMDVVYNHMFDAKQSCFEKAEPDYFFRKRMDNTPMRVHVEMRWLRSIRWYAGILWIQSATGRRNITWMVFALTLWGCSTQRPCRNWESD